LKEVEEDRQRIAREKYATKVCERYLGLPRETCYKVFEEMKRKIKIGMEIYGEVKG